MGIIDRIFKKTIEKKAAAQAQQIGSDLAGQAISNYNKKIKAYYGGSSGAYRSAGAKWNYGLSSSGGSQYIDHVAMRQNARAAFHDSMDARAITERFADSVVDTGLILDSMPAYEVLGITPEEAEAWGSDVSRRFHLWAMSKAQHRSGTMNFYQFQRLYHIQQQRDNDIFVRLFYSSSKKLQNPLQYDFIDANQIRGYGYTSTYAQTQTSDGIEANSDGTERLYKVWVRSQKNDGTFENVDIRRIGEKSGRVMMLHGFNPEYAGQRRGYSRLGFALQELQNITDLTLAQIKKAINQSNMVAFTKNTQQDPSNPLEGMANDLTSALGSNLSESAQETLETLTRGIDLCPLPEASLDTPGSMAVFNLTKGDDLVPFVNSTPSEPFKDFVMVFLERLSSASGMPVEVLSMKFGQNYSASRATLVLFWRIVQMWRDEMAADCLNPIFEMWLSEEIASGRISAPGWNDPILYAAWFNCQWIGSPLPSIDPGKESKARKDNLEMNITNGERESRNLNGSSLKDNISKNKKSFPVMPIPSWGVAKKGAKI
jgi:lambda family phage portal protein